MSNELSKDFNDKAQTLGERLMEITDHALGSAKFEELTQAMQSLALSDHQKDVIQRNGTQAFRNAEMVLPEMEKRLAHSLRDPLAKASSAISMGAEFGESDMVYSGLIGLRDVIEAHTHNFSMFFDGKADPSVQTALDQIEQLRPAVDELISEMEEKHGFSEDQLDQKEKAWDYVKAISDEEYNTSAPA